LDQPFHKLKGSLVGFDYAKHVEYQRKIKVQFDSFDEAVAHVLQGRLWAKKKSELLAGRNDIELPGTASQAFLDMLFSACDAHQTELLEYVSIYSQCYGLKQCAKMSHEIMNLQPDEVGLGVKTCDLVGSSRPIKLFYHLLARAAPNCVRPITVRNEAGVFIIFISQQGITGCIRVRSGGEMLNSQPPNITIKFGDKYLNMSDNGQYVSHLPVFQVCEPEVDEVKPFYIFTGKRPGEYSPEFTKINPRLEGRSANIRWSIAIARYFA
jgi:hypothetical protein